MLNFFRRKKPEGNGELLKQILKKVTEMTQTTAELVQELEGINAAAGALKTEITVIGVKISTALEKMAELQAAIVVAADAIPQVVTDKVAEVKASLDEVKVTADSVSVLIPD